MEMKKYKLGELMDVTRGQSLSGEYYSKSGNLVRLTLGNFDYHNNCFKDDKSKDNLYFTGSVKKEFILKKDDIITPLTEQAIGLLGSTAKIPCSGKYIQSQDVALIKCNKKLNPDFAFYLIPSKIVRNQLSAAAQQTKIRHTSPDKIKDCSVWVPEYSEQEKIGKLLSRIDNKIAINRQINRNLEELAKQIYDYWFVQFDFPNEDGKPYKSSGGKMVWNETLKRNIPEGWEVKKVDELAEIQKKQITPKENIEYKHYSLPNFDKYESYSIENGNTIFSDKFFVESGNLLISKLNPWTDRTVWVDDVNNAICSTEYVVLKQNDKCIQSYLNQIAHTQSFIDYCTSCSTGTSHSHRRVKPELMTGYKVPFQENIVKAFGKQIYPIIKKKLNIQNENRNLIIFRDELLPLLMNGQVTLNSCLSHD